MDIYVITFDTLVRLLVWIRNFMTNLLIAAMWPRTQNQIHKDKGNVNIYYFYRSLRLHHCRLSNLDNRCTCTYCKNIVIHLHIWSCPRNTCILKEYSNMARCRKLLTIEIITNALNSYRFSQTISFPFKTRQRKRNITLHLQNKCMWRLL